MSTQYRLVQSGKTASGGCSAGQGSSEPVAPRIYIIYNIKMVHKEIKAQNFLTGF
jgi:carbohydrate-binding DOMON domain-containing protein